MYEDHTVGVVIPAYNEAGFVGDVIETVPSFVDRIYPVDDRSTDGTWDEIRAAAAAIDGDRPSISADGGARPTGASTNGADVPAGVDDGAPSAVEVDASLTAAGDADRFDRRVVPIRHEENRGVGGAIKTGYQRARADRIDVTVVMGGDGQMDPAWMADLIEPVVDGRAEYAKANRLLVPEHHETMPGHRFVGNHLLTVLTKIATGYWSVGDPQHGYTAISLEALETAGIDELFEYFGYCNDLLVRLSAANLRVADVPCPLTYADEESHIAYRSYVPRVSGMLLRSFLRRLWVDRDARGGRGRLALFLGGAIATAGGLVGVVAAGVSGGDDRSTDEPATDPGAEMDLAADTATSGAGDADTAASGAGDADTATSGVGDADERATPEGTSSGGSGVCRAALAAVAGVAALLGAMLLDAVMNSSHNYTERLSEDAGPRVGEPGATDEQAAREERAAREE
jgi:glycosyltransferase involved in cell wall biosynthesis